MALAGIGSFSQFETVFRNQNQLMLELGECPKGVESGTFAALTEFGLVINGAATGPAHWQALGLNEAANFGKLFGGGGFPGRVSDAEVLDGDAFPEDESFEVLGQVLMAMEPGFLVCSGCGCLMQVVPVFQAQGGEYADPIVDDHLNESKVLLGEQVPILGVAQNGLSHF